MATSNKRAKAGRRAGRPSGDDQDLRRRLLDAAIAQFARTGIAATSLRAIATEAGVTPAMLHYYFGDKARLQQALIDERLLPALAPLRTQLEHAGDDPAALIEGFVRGIGELVVHHPWLPPLWVREVLCEGGALRDVLFTQAVPGVPQLLAQRFAAAQADGRLNAALDPRLLVVSLVGLTLFPAAGAPIWRRAFGAEELGAEVMLRHTLALLGHGIGAAEPGETA
ncbi:TetR/AcrR family transcriptional regulator [Rhodanobacter sp. FDAARGOS 1247]|uniref:TetR/AcrR family transcriptional regulator n=1 Tax=Rhodanobacter sp. FDAARGOS 1247 TaxID=2778082 RepID=UPI00195154CF|nr:TetR/AcrR family transcriptional regulator [Rhodanobacter sp. FDAARGOS 1247]QRP62968.1 TetR/AcrR family transcriptional regulator [Rhodanobacter sp. FDAARGOS 1247]